MSGASEVDTDRTGIFVNAGTTQLVSTPYALFAAGAYPTGNAGGDLRAITLTLQLQRMR